MRTDDFIKALATDYGPKPMSLQRALAIAILTGSAAALLGFLATLEVRPDVGEAMHSVRFLFKYLVTLSLAVVATVVVLRLLRPGVHARPMVMAIVPVLLVGAVAVEMWIVPPTEWLAHTFAHAWYLCVFAIFLLSLGPLAAILLALRHGAPSSPAGSGAVAGLLAGAIGAAVYVAHCPMDSPLFVAAWYTLAIAATGLLGAILGSRLLRWRRKRVLDSRRVASAPSFDRAADRGQSRRPILRCAAPAALPALVDKGASHRSRIRINRLSSA